MTISPILEGLNSQPPREAGFASTRDALASTEYMAASTRSRQFVPRVEDVEGVEANLTTLWGD